MDVFFFPGLVNNVSCMGHTPCNGSISLNEELSRMGRESIMLSSKEQFQHLAAGTEENRTFMSIQ
jgi:hypothetical protein